MIRRSLIAFLVVLIVSLIFVVGYAALNLSGPASTVDDATIAFQRAEYSKAIRKLDVAERSLGANGSIQLRIRILRLRREAHLQLDNLSRALDDIEALAKVGKSRPDAVRALSLDPVQLEMDRIYYTLRAGDGERALELARAFLVETPDNARALELAGEASFALFAEQYAEVKDEVDEQFDSEVAREADELLKVWLYRDESDSLAQLSFRDFKELLRRLQPTTPMDSQFRGRLHGLRQLIQQAQEYCRAAIIAPEGQPVAAYQLLRTSLAKGKRDDDIQALAETYIARFEHVYTIDAASDLAELHVENGRFSAAIEVATRYLPDSEWEARLDAGRLSSEIGRLWSAKATALRVLRDQPGAKALDELVETVQASGRLDLGLSYHWIRAQTLLTRKLFVPSRDELNTYIQGLGEVALTEATRKKLADAIEVNLLFARGKNTPNAYRLWLQTRLTRYDPTNPEPYLEAIRLNIEEGQTADARRICRRLQQIDPHNEELLKLSSRVSDLDETDTGRGASELLEDFLRTGDVPSNIPTPALWAVIAERALESGHPEVAYEAALNGANQFNWAKWPRILQAEAAFALGDVEKAKAAASGILTFYPDDADGNLLLERARRLAGEPYDDLVFTALSNARTDSSVAQALLRAARERQDLEFATALANQIIVRFKDDPEALLVVADFFLSTKSYSKAQRALEIAGKSIDPATDQDLFAATKASALMIAAIVRSTSRDKIESLRKQVRELYRGRTEDLFRFAQVLSQIGTGTGTRVNQIDPLELAYDLLSPVLTDPEHRAERTGEHFVLGGKLALKLGKQRRAQDHLNAALRFSDDGSASRDLTLLNLSQDSGFDATETYWETQAVDLTSACLLARVGKRIRALGWAESEQQSFAVRPAAMALRALLDERRQSIPELAEIVQKAPAALLDTLTFLEADGFEATAIDRASALFNLFKSNRVCSFFLARAFAEGGNRERALEILQDLMVPNEFGDFVWAHQEAARLLQDAPSDEVLLTQIISPFMDGALPPPQAVRQVAFEKTAEKWMADPEKRSQALELLANLYQDRAETVKLEDVGLFESSERPDLALAVLIKIEPFLPASQKAQSIQTYFRLVSKILATTPNTQLAETAERKAQRVLQSQGNFGAVVHFLLDREEERSGALADRQDPERVGRAKRLLNQHLEMFLARRDEDREFLLTSLERLATLVSRTEVLERCEQILRYDPSLVDVWLLRAEWLMLDGRVKAGYDSLRWIENLLPLDVARLRVTELRTRLGQDESKTMKLLELALGEATLNLPKHAFVRGMIELRAGEYDSAAKFFEDCPEQADGGHLFYRALAELAIGNREVAGECFGKLAEFYPTSLLSENAGQFASFCSH